MKVTVTGGAGFIGSHLVEALLEEGHEVYTVDDLSTGKREFLSRVESHPKLRFVRGDVRDRRLIASCLDDSEVVYHLAAVVGVRHCVEDPLYVIEGNVDGTRVVLEEAYKRGVKVVFASTSEVYGKNQALPFREDSDRVLGPTHVHRWCYATAKALDEHLCFAYAQKGLPVTVVRYFNAYGPRATATLYGGVVPRFITAAIRGDPLYVYGSGSQRRCFAYVDDIVKGTLLATSSRADGKVINLGSPFETSILDLAHRIRRLTKSDSPIVMLPYEQAYGTGYQDVPRRVPDLTLAQSLLGYHPQVGLERGLLKTIVWYLAQEEWAE